MNRRGFVAGLGALLAVPLATEAQKAGKVARIGYLEIEISPGDSGLQAFLQQLRDFGYVEGRNLLIEYRDAMRKPDRFPPPSRMENRGDAGRYLHEAAKESNLH